MSDSPRDMNVLMYGWELPPYNSGGLGTACLGLTESLANLDVDIDFVLPKSHGPFTINHMRIHSASDYPTTPRAQALLRYAQAKERALASGLAYGATYTEQGAVEYTPQSPNQFPAETQARWYAAQAAPLVNQQDFSLIHCHDWMTYYSGMQARQLAKRQGVRLPLVAHVHATELDRGGEHGNQAIVAIERKGLQAADQVVAVSHYTKGIIHKHYGIAKDKIAVVHNGIAHSVTPPSTVDLAALKKQYKLVLFMGRLTMQKGPEFFLKLAQNVTGRDPQVKFLMCGSGDMENSCIEQAAAMGLAGKVLFSSFLRGNDVNRAYRMADLFVMPSVSEPFGLVALEAMQHGTPVLVSKQSGVAEVSKAVAQADFWDSEKMAALTLEILHNPDYAAQFKLRAHQDLQQLSWDNAAGQLKEVYSDLLTRFQPHYA